MPDDEPHAAAGWIEAVAVARTVTKTMIGFSAMT
jgi:hypothetical protein